MAASRVAGGERKVPGGEGKKKLVALPAACGASTVQSGLGPSRVHLTHRRLPVTFIITAISRQHLPVVVVF